MSLKILVPFVESPAGRAAVERAAERAGLSPGSVIRLLGHVRVLETDADAQASRLRGALGNAAESLRGKGHDCDIAWSIGPQTLSTRVIDAATDWKADLIVMGIRPRSRVGKFILGSHEQSILLQAECPVLTVKAERW